MEVPKEQNKEQNHDHENEVIYFARTSFRNQFRKFGIKTDDRRRHTYIIGKTGMGKTVLMENMILSDIYAGHGCAYVDPHGDTAERLIDFIPSWRINDVVYFNPADVDFPIGFNILESVNERYKHLVASGMMGVFKKIWENVWSARMEYILNNSILALLDNPGSTLLGINRMLSDAEYRKKIVSNVKDPIVKQFWLTEFASYNEKYAQEAVAPIQNKIGQFLSASIIRNIVAQVKSTINIRELMDNKKIVIMNLSKGRIGEDNSRLLGGMLITKLQLAAMERVDMPETDRHDFYMYVDEFQNFAVESFASILSEARKYRLCLIMAHQYVAQLSDEVREAVFGNVGTIITFRVGAPDATFMETEFAPRFLPEDIINLPKYHIYLKLLIDGVTSQPFSALTLPPIAKRTESQDKVIRVSRERYSCPRSDIEEKILRWSGMGEDVDVDKLLAEAEEKKKTMKESRKPKFEYNCTRCGKQIVLPVELDRSRPIYCEDCIQIVREERKNSKEKKQIKNAGPSASVPVPLSTEQPQSNDAVAAFTKEVSISLAALAPKTPQPTLKAGGPTNGSTPTVAKPTPQSPPPKPQMPAVGFEAPPVVQVVKPAVVPVAPKPVVAAPSVAKPVTQVAAPALPRTVSSMPATGDGTKKKRRRRKKKTSGMTEQGGASGLQQGPRVAEPIGESTRGLAPMVVSAPTAGAAPTPPNPQPPVPRTSGGAGSGSAGQPTDSGRLQTGQSIKFD